MAVVLITGAGSGFGLEACMAFARNGDTVVAGVRDATRTDTLVERLGSENLRAHVIALDVTRTERFPEIIAEVVETHGALDVVVNNAGIHRAGSLEDVSEEAFRAVMDTNCTGPLMLARAALPQMRAQGNGLIIMMSSLSGIAGLPGDLPYTASKFALEGATEALRHEVDRFGIRVALVEAAMYKTGIMQRNFGSDALPEDYPDDSPYKSLIAWQLENLSMRMPAALDPAIVGQLFVNIATSNESRLRWPADAVAERVLETMFAQNDEQRDEFLREVAGSDWWSKGDTAPPDN